MTSGVVPTITPVSADEVLVHLRTLGDQFLFRGQSNSEWGLASSLERSGLENLDTVERRMLGAFPRRAANYLPLGRVPKDGDTLGWSSILQHYGAPTRLLDWTRSPYVALFFALEKAAVHSGDPPPALWTLRSNVLLEKATRIVAANKDVFFNMDGSTPKVHPGWARLYARERHPALVRSLAQLRKGMSMVAIAEPYQLDVRQAAQQSIFLCQGNMEITFLENIQRSGLDIADVLSKIVVPWDC